jgi:hypothetical protein
MAQEQEDVGSLLPQVAETMHLALGVLQHHITE